MSCWVRWSIGRTSAPHAEEAGSIPARATPSAAAGGGIERRVAEWQTRGPQKLVPLGVGVQVSPRRLMFRAIAKFPRRDRCPAGPHKAGSPGSIPGPGTRGWAGARPSFIRSDAVVQLPDPQSSRWHGTQTGRAARLRVWCLWVRIPPVLLRNSPTPAPCRQRPVVQWRRRLSHTEEMGVRLPPGRLRNGSQVISRLPENDRHIPGCLGSSPASASPDPQPRPPMSGGFAGRRYPCRPQPGGARVVASLSFPRPDSSPSPLLTARRFVPDPPEGELLTCSRRSRLQYHG